MTPQSRTTLLLAAAILVMVDICRSSLVQTPLQSVSLPSSTIRGYHPLTKQQLTEGAPAWKFHARHLEDWFRSRFVPNVNLVTNSPSPTTSSGLEGSPATVFGHPTPVLRPFTSSRTRVGLESGQRVRPDDRQPLRSSLLNLLSKYRDHEIESDFQLVDETRPQEKFSSSPAGSNYRKENYDYKDVIKEIISDEFKPVVVQEHGSGRGRVKEPYPDLPKYLASQEDFKNSLANSFQTNSLAHANIDAVENFLSSQGLGNSNGASFPDWGDDFRGTVPHDFLIFPQGGRTKSVSEPDDFFASDTPKTHAMPSPPKTPQPQRFIVPGDSENVIPDFKVVQGNAQIINAAKQQFSEGKAKDSSTNSPGNKQAVNLAAAQKDEKSFLKLKDLVRVLPKLKALAASSSRGRRSVAEKEEAALHADQCHAHNLRACGQPAMKKLLKGIDMKTKCRVREEFLNCMGEKRFQPCPPSTSTPTGDPKGSKLHPFDDPLLRDLRKSLRKGLATNCIFGYSRAENATLDI